MKQILWSVFFFLVGLLTGLQFASAENRDLVGLERKDAPVAIVYKGKGACSNCITGAKNAAWAAGLKVVLVDQRLKDFSILDRARVWIQPGGFSGVAINAMGPAYLSRVREFVRNGGGYVGFCAGAFMATDYNGNTGLQGLGLIPGKSIAIFKDGSIQDHSYIFSMTWNGNVHRSVYFHGGPYFDLTGVNDPNLKIFATYDQYDNRVAGIFTRFGKGKVSVVGSHPEEIKIMKVIQFLIDPDGSDLAYAVEMIRSVL